ncbi:signal recognition particle-docking protein FtsY [Catenovulum adriaticum]|uniref:Signal recognition particle receptor FtsY n=1 Tax=Catenovulum adriaticum TaxID=2984846 RepID=A0ABY7ALG2_9ALTE|nr:signal recognition particle-docking protein FtsY [Catenovulum sp. TS8]WAJ69996.1 signal recognition particle-docking protein FtsY [Catenovulum sp. TS8]
MNKKKGLFGWFGQKNKTKDEQKTVEEAQQVNKQTEQAEAVEAPQKKEEAKSSTPVNSPEIEQIQPADSSPQAALSESEENNDIPTQVEEPAQRPQKIGFFSRLKQSLTRTKASIGSGLFGLFKGKKIDDDLLEELETQLLMADLGIETTTRVIDSVTQTAKKQGLTDAEALYSLLKEKMREILGEVNQPLELSVPNSDGPFVMLMVGVNGVGKTTTIGKLAKQYQQQGKSVMLAAGDTFRAAAVEQLQVWGQRNNINVVAQHTGADSASVVYDAFASAKAKNIDVLIADTAGRLQNKAHLMEELKKIVRVMKKIDPKAPHEVMLVIDSTTGQNAISQTKLFDEAVGLTGISLTKLDGTAKGGVIFSVADQFKVPIRYIGVGEGIDDLRPFDADEFIEALFSTEDKNEQDTSQHEKADSAS